MKKASLLLAVLLAFALVMPLAAQDKVLTYNLSANPRAIDPALSEAVDDFAVIVANFEGLMRIQKNGTIGPGVAESYSISKDGLTYTFKLRKNAKWSDGKPVTAKDFVYAWKRAMDPATAAAYVFQMDYIAGKTPEEQMKSVVMKDDYTIQVTLEAPTPYFLELVSTPIYYPVRQDMIEANGDKWTQDPATYIGNGPFVMTKWAPNDVIEWKKSTTYWKAAQIAIEKMSWSMIVEATSYLGAWESKQIDMIEVPPAAEMPRLFAEKKVVALPYIGTYAVVINLKDPAFQDVRVRKALALAINTQAIIDVALKGGQKPGAGWVPYGIFDADGKTDFRAKAPVFMQPKANLEEAKRLMAAAGYPGGKGFPKVTYAFNTSEAHKKIGEMLQSMWKQLGIEVELVNSEWAVFQQTRKDGQFMLARQGWIGDYMDPMTFMDLFVSTSDFNDGKYNNPAYDSYIAKAKAEPNPVTRMGYLHAAEKLLLEEWGIIPLYHYVLPVCTQPWLKGVVKTPTGAILFDYATIDWAAKAKK